MSRAFLSTALGRNAWTALAVVLAFAGTTALAAEKSNDADANLQAEFAAEVAKFQPHVEEAARVKACVDADLARRGLDMEAAMDVLDAVPDAAALRANLIRLLEQDVALSEDDRAKLAGDQRLRVPYLGYQLKGAATFDLGTVVRAIAVQSVYLDRALGSQCHPSNELVTLIGVTRAD